MNAYITSAQAGQIAARERARHASPAAASTPAPYTARELRKRIDALLCADVSRGREALALALILAPGVSVDQALGAMRVAGIERDA